MPKPVLTCSCAFCNCTCTGRAFYNDHLAFCCSSDHKLTFTPLLSCSVLFCLWRHSSQPGLTLVLLARLSLPLTLVLHLQSLVLTLLLLDIPPVPLITLILNLKHIRTTQRIIITVLLLLILNILILSTVIHTLPNSPINHIHIRLAPSLLATLLPPPTRQPPIPNLNHIHIPNVSSNKIFQTCSKIPLVHPLPHPFFLSCPQRASSLVSRAENVIRKNLKTCQPSSRSLLPQNV